MGGKGLILVSVRYSKKYSHDRYKIFFGRLSKELNFRLTYTDKIDVPKDIDVVIVGLQRTYTNSMMELANLDKRVKMIGILGDLHSLGNIPGNDIKMLNRYDMILGFNDETFKRMYPQFMYKFTFFPQFFAPHERYVDLSISKKPQMRCLLAGNLYPKWTYPFRNYIHSKRGNSKIDTLPYPGTFLKGMKKGKGKFFLGDRYVKKLNSYFCCVVTSGFLGGVVAKFLEVPAAGSLMLCNEALDLVKMGMIANVHYVSINKASVFTQINKCLENPLKYEKIRKCGMELVRERHSINNRIQELKRYVASI